MIDLLAIKPAALPPPFDPAKVTRCEPCAGQGYITTYKYQDARTIEILHICDACDGTGYRKK